MQEKLPLDARLLSDAIIELNISRHNVSIYPKDHPLVSKSLNRAFEYFRRLFELRDEITIAIAKDTIIIDEYSLDKKNPVFKDFALHLNRMSIASVTFTKNLTKDELYSFHRFLLEDTEGMSLDAIREKWKGYDLPNIRLGFIDYSAFGEADGEASKKKLYEWYVHGLLEGTLRVDSLQEGVDEIPPEILAKLINETSTEDLKEESYDRVIASYLRKSSERAFSGKDIKRLLDFINGLRPELKKEFLSSSMNKLSKDIKSVEEALRETPIDTVMTLLKNINEQKLSIPDELRKLLERFSSLETDAIESRIFREEDLVDDITVSSDIASLISDERFDRFVDETYRNEIQRLLDSDAPAGYVEDTEGFNAQWDEEYIERCFNEMILEILLSGGSEVVREEDYEFFNRLLKDQIEELISTAQYGEVLRILRVWKERLGGDDGDGGASSYIHSPETISLFIDSLRISGRQKREEALELCRFYGERIIPPLIHALIQEESQTVRHFLLSLIISFGRMAEAEAIKHLRDERWYVKRNMLFILTEIRSTEGLPHARPLCRHEHPRVSFQAIKYLLRMGDPYGVDMLKEHLEGKTEEGVRQALLLAGTFRVKELVPDLIRMLKKKALKSADYQDKIQIVRALGLIGDPSALDALRDILHSRSILFKTPLRRLKEEIQSTLKHYPPEDVREIIGEVAL
jgi:hypothetical protein